MGHRLYKFKFKITTLYLASSESCENAMIIPNPWLFACRVQLEKIKIILNSNWDVIVCVVRHMCRQMGAWFPCSACQCENWMGTGEKKRENNPKTNSFGPKRDIPRGEGTLVLLVRDNSISNASCLCVNRVKTQRLLFDLCRRTMVALVEVQTLDKIERLHSIATRMNRFCAWIEPFMFSAVRWRDARFGLSLTLIVLKRRNEMQIFSH